MNVEVLLSCMNQKDFSIIDKMNIATDVVVVNQCDTDEVHTFEHKGSRVIWCNSTERGLSKSRNLAMKYVRQEICLLADDDEVFVDDYEKIIVEEFEKLNNADLIFFNLYPKNPKHKWYVNQKIKKLKFYNILRYGSPRLAFKSRSVINEISFNELFGSGATFNCGEDSLFFMECLQAKLSLFASPKYIAEIEDGDSTWFDGYTEKFFFTKGVFFAQMSKRYSLLLNFQYLFRYYEQTKNIGFFKAYKAIMNGRRTVLLGKHLNKN